LGIEKFDTDFTHYAHHTDSYIAKTIYEKETGLPFESQKIIEFENILYQNIVKEKVCVEIEGARDFVKRIENETDYGVCFATGSMLRTAKYKLDQIGIDYSEQQLVASNSILDREGIVSSAIENAKSVYEVENFTKIISFGDGLWDLITAKNLNISFIGIGLTNKEVLLNSGCKEVYANYSELNLKDLDNY
jgi:phosphoglycolate phosphatase-like HAD superfamily hydrolase